MAKQKAGTDTPTPPRPAARPIRARRPPAGPPPRGGAPAVKDHPIKVRATQTGYYDHARRREGDVFTIANEQAFSPRWMERVPAQTPERITTAAQHIRREHDKILGGVVVTGDRNVLDE